MAKRWTILVKASKPAMAFAFARIHGLEPLEARPMPRRAGVVEVVLLATGAASDVAAWFRETTGNAPYPAGTCLVYRELDGEG